MQKKTVGLYTTITLFALFAAGCGPTVPQPQLPEKQEAPKRAMWQDTSYAESNYQLKPEPYSLDSDEHDPELLGPQSTLRKPLAGNNVESTSSTEAFLPKEEPKPAKPSSGMDRSRCISLIGKAKFDEYTKQFGSEAAAIRKCVILERVQKQ